MTTNNQTTDALIAKLQQLYPAYQWNTTPIGDYDQNAELGAPETLICFSNDDVYCCDEIVDAFSTFTGEVCDPSVWGLSTEVADLIRAHNKIHVATLNEFNSPMFLANSAK